MIIENINYDIIKDCALRLKYLKDFFFSTNIYIINKEDADKISLLIRAISGICPSIRNGHICFINKKSRIEIWYGDGLKTIGRWSRSNLAIVDTETTLNEILNLYLPTNNLKPNYGTYYYDVENFDYFKECFERDLDKQQFYIPTIENEI
jgi:hypothetical protein